MRIKLHLSWTLCCWIQYQCSVKLSSLLQFKPHQSIYLFSTIWSYFNQFAHINTSKCFSFVLLLQLNATVNLTDYSCHRLLYLMLVQHCWINTHNNFIFQMITDVIWVTFLMFIKRPLLCTLVRITANPTFASRITCQCNSVVQSVIDLFWTATISLWTKLYCFERFPYFHYCFYYLLLWLLSNFVVVYHWAVL